MIILRTNISEESGTIQVQRYSCADGPVTEHERTLLARLLKALTLEFGEFSKSIGAGPVVSTVHRKLMADPCPEVAAPPKPSLSNVETGGNAS